MSWASFFPSLKADPLSSGSPILKLPLIMRISGGIPSNWALRLLAEAKIMRLMHKLLNMNGQICFFLWILSASFGMICGVEAATSGEDSLYHSHGKRDPFVPLITMTSREAAGLLGVENIDDIIIEGIVYDPKHGSVAIVNGSVL